jgi:predicted RNA-binding Zn ribbon-like protein
MPPRILVPLIGEPLALDLINTRRQPERAFDDVFASVEGLAQWLVAQADRLPTVRVAESTCTRLIMLRDAVALALDALMSGRRPTPAAVDVINDALRGAPSYQQVAWGTAGGQLDTVRAGDHDAQLLAMIGEASVEYLLSEHARATRRCEAPDCEMLFSPSHPRRRWCSPTVCGNRTRVARYYERHRDPA